MLGLKLKNLTVKVLEITEPVFCSMENYQNAKNQHHSSVQSHFADLILVTNFDTPRCT